MKETLETAAYLMLFVYLLYFLAFQHVVAIKAFIFLLKNMEKLGFVSF